MIGIAAIWAVEVEFVSCCVELLEGTSCCHLQQSV